MLKFLVYFLLFVHNYVYANNEILLSCAFTPAIWNDEFNDNIVKNNNLRRKTGAAEFAEGEFIDIKGRVLDENCVPVSEAIVEIWQVDSAGNNWQDIHQLDNNFNYSGTAITDNLGRYLFSTIFPGIKNNNAPKIHIRVRHYDFSPFETYMYFPNNIYNSNDLSLRNIAKHQQKLLIAEYIENNNFIPLYNFNIVLTGSNKYKRY